MSLISLSKSRCFLHSLKRAGYFFSLLTLGITRGITPVGLLQAQITIETCPKVRNLQYWNVHREEFAVEASMMVKSVENFFWLQLFGRGPIFQPEAIFEGSLSHTLITFQDYTYSGLNFIYLIFTRAMIIHFDWPFTIFYGFQEFATLFSKFQCWDRLRIPNWALHCWHNFEAILFSTYEHFSISHKAKKPKQKLQNGGQEENISQENHQFCKSK